MVTVRRKVFLPVSRMSASACQCGRLDASAPKVWPSHSCKALKSMDSPLPAKTLAARDTDGASAAAQPGGMACARRFRRSEEHTSELQSLMRISYAVFCLKKKKQNIILTISNSSQQR